MEEQSRVWVSLSLFFFFSMATSKEIKGKDLDLHFSTIIIVDLGGSLAVASRGLFATGVTTDLNGEHNQPSASNRVYTYCKQQACI